jgi:hypothetical protein
MRVRIHAGMSNGEFLAYAVLKIQVHVHRLQLRQGVDSGQFNQQGMSEPKTGVFSEDVLLIQRTGFLTDYPERVARNLIRGVGDPLNLDCAVRYGDDLGGRGRVSDYRFRLTDDLAFIRRVEIDTTNSISQQAATH